MVQHEDLIASKLVPPIRDTRAISRAALVQLALGLLDKGGLITVVAPAGSGKSSLMTEIDQSLAACDFPSSWLGLDAEDNDPTTFALYFIRALQAIEPDFARHELTALRANPVRDFDALFVTLCSRLSGLRVSATVFLDDFQNITDPRIIGFIDRLLVHLPPGLSLVIASRHQLPLEFARLLVAGQVVEIGPLDLNFSPAEMAQFLDRYYALRLSGDELQALDDNTEGWPAGVQLIALALRRHEGPVAELIERFSGRDRDLTRYLVESVLRVQPEAVQWFLLRTSPLRRMSAALCAAVINHDDAKPLLDYVGQANLFLIALDREGQWFRYHHLFAEFLQHEFRSRDEDGFRRTCLRAAQWCEANGHPTEAIRYALNAGHFEHAVELIARNAMRVSMFDGDHYTVREWIRQLPEEYHSSRPEILLSQAWSSAFSRDTRNAMQVSQDAIDMLACEQSSPWALSEAERESWLLWAKNVQAATKACSDDIEECIERASTLFPQVPESEPFLTATLSNCLSYGHFTRREFEQSRRYALQAHEHGHRAHAHYLSAWGDFLHGMIDVEIGNLNAAGTLARGVEKDSQGLGLGQQSYVAGLAALLRVEIAVQRGDFATAAQHIGVGRAFKDIFGPAEPQLVALRNEARLHVFNQSEERALEVLREGQEAALREEHRRLYFSLAMEEVSLQLSADALDGAKDTLRRTRLLETGRKPINLFRAQRDALKLLGARLSLANGDTDIAMRGLTSLQQSRGAETIGGFALTVMTHRAIAFWNMGKRNDAARQLDRALVAAAKEFHAYPIAAAGPRLLPVLNYVAEQRPTAASDELRPVLEMQRWLIERLSGNAAARIPKLSKATRLQTQMHEALTDRELEILRHLHAGLTNKQLAEGLLLSVPTIKWHLHNIYSKLGVGSRGAAVAAAVAREMI